MPASRRPDPFRTTPAWTSLGAIALLLLSGCGAPPAQTAPEASDPEGFVASGLRAARTVHLSKGGYGFEPSLRVDDLGTIYASAAQGGRPGLVSSHLWVSNDGGKQFRKIAWASTESGVSNFPRGSEGDLAIDDAGTAYFIDSTRDAGSVSVARSTDQGRTWVLTNPSFMVAPGGDRPWIGAGPKDMIVVTWEGMTGVWVSVSLTGGLGVPVQTFLGYGPFPGGIEVASDGTIYITASVPTGLQLFRSIDRGLTFTKHMIWETDNHTKGIFSPLAIDKTGTAYATWAEYDETTTRIYYAWSADQGATWSPRTLVSDPEGTAAYPSIVAADAGHIAVAFYGAPGAIGHPQDVDAEWWPFVAEIVKATSDRPEVFLGRPADHPAKKGSICIRSSECPNGKGRELGEYVQVAFRGPLVELVWTELTKGSGDQKRQIHWAEFERASSTST